MAFTSGREQDQANNRSASRSGGELFGFAELWDGWKNADGQWIKSCTILTTLPNSVTSAVRDRMPVILHPDSYELWLDPGMNSGAVVSDLLKSYDAKSMRCSPISTRVNRVENDDKECSRRVEVAEDQKQFFV